MSRRDFGCLEGYFGCLEGYFGCLEGFSKVGIFVSKKTMEYCFIPSSNLCLKRSTLSIFV